MKKSLLNPITYFVIFCAIIIIVIFTIKKPFVNGFKITNSKEKASQSQEEVTQSNKKIELSEDQIKELISENIPDQISDVSVQITQANIEISGKIKKFSGMTGVITVRPEVKNNKIQFIIQKIKVSVITIPEIIKDELENKLNSSISDKIGTQDKIKSVTLEADKMIIFLNN